MEAYNPPIHAPELPRSHWINSYVPFEDDPLIGKVSLIDFWDFTCINCLRTLPYKRAWHSRYSESGFQILGIHTPEFNFGREEVLLRRIVGSLGIPWPVVQDNDQSLWVSFANSVRPTVYLIDAERKIQLRQEGEGFYGDIEESIQKFLLEFDPGIELPQVLLPLKAEDVPGAACYPITPELRIGSIDSLQFHSNQIQEFPVPERLYENQISLSGRWKISNDGVTAVQPGCSIHLAYQADKCYAVLAPGPDFAGDPTLPLGYSPVKLYQDDTALAPEVYGDDVVRSLDDAIIRVDFPRLYSLTNNHEVRYHELRLDLEKAGLTFYAFSFGTCMIPEDTPAST